MVLRSWYPDHPPTWSTVITGCIALLWLPLNSIALETIDWLWVSGGAIVGVIALGPVARSLAETRVSAWDRVGKNGRRIVVLCIVAAAVAAGLWIDAPPVPTVSFVGGFMIAISVHVAMHVVHFGEIRGWL
ncbi:hypothetical protein [Natronobacterium texcoconense]|uniref:Uncharacterized protein n=1 Tax=Natronobacterium texcoconense TaxID=1095778 RepID=A0A1H0Z585_NATTX|nr:hypothetical protein [Natronobacterium texcoconense]SDQ22534.1 hypothetical protein SAMN04489842_0137 [Natronobacterium texcoconense]